jgi:hypothetical protein
MSASPTGLRGSTVADFGRAVRDAMPIFKASRGRIKYYLPDDMSAEAVEHRVTAERRAMLEIALRRLCSCRRKPWPEPEHASPDCIVHGWEDDDDC